MSSPPLAVEPTTIRGWRIWPQALSLFVLVALAHAIYVSLYASAIPYWDQWDDLDRTVRAWVDGTFGFSSLVAPHNEHRIAFTRVVTLALFEANGGTWDNLVQAYVNAFIYAGLLTTLFCLPLRPHAGPAERWLLLVAVALIGVLPFGWENTLVGFQNQFYFMALAALVMVGVASHGQARISTAALLLVFGVASLFTMASGLLACGVAAMLLLVRAWTGQVRSSHALLTSSALLLIAAAGLLLTPHPSGHDIYRAKGVLDHLRALLRVLVWPAQSTSPKHVVIAALVWAPSCHWLIRTLRSRTAPQGELVAAGVAGWTFLQALAIAHARGHDMLGLSPRYADIPAIGVLANAALALRYLTSSMPSPRIRRAALATLTGVAAVIVLTLARRTPEDVAFMRQHLDLVEVQRANVSAYLATGDASALEQPWRLIPYPNAGRLRRLLEIPSIRQSLYVPDTRLRDQSGRPLRSADATLRVVPDESAPLSRLAERTQAAVRILFSRFGYLMPDPLFHEVQATPALRETATSTAGMCAIDSIDWKPAGPETVTRPNASLIFSGWAVDSRHRAARRFSLLLVGPRTYRLQGVTGFKRSDLARALGSRKARWAGFYAMGKLPNVLPGRYDVLVVARDSPTSLYCHSGRRIVVESTSLGARDDAAAAAGSYVTMR